MPHGTPGLTPRERLVARAGHYVGFTLLFLAIYGGTVYTLGRFPEPLLLGILVVSLAKDIYDEVRLRRGRMPLGYAGIEHAPSNAVLIGFVLAGVIEPAGTVGSVVGPAVDVVDPTGTVGDLSVESVALGLAVVDLLFDISQDLRA